MDQKNTKEVPFGCYIPPNKRNGDEGSLTARTSSSPQKPTGLANCVEEMNLSAKTEPLDMAKIKEEHKKSEKSEGTKLIPRQLTRRPPAPNANNGSGSSSEHTNNHNRPRQPQLPSRSSQNSRNGSRKEENKPSCCDDGDWTIITSEATMQDLRSVHEQYYDSHCHIDMIYRNLRCMHREGLASWMAKFPDAFNPFFVGCIPNFIEPSLFVPNPHNLNAYDIGWIRDQMNDKAMYAGSTFGCHPHQVKTWGRNEALWETLERIFIDPRFRCIAVGECGIDLYRCESALEDQIDAFRRQIQLAFKYDLALVIHCRKGPKGDSEKKCLEILQEEFAKPGQHKWLRIHRHCYTESWDNAKKWIKVCPNIVFGFTPTVFKFHGAQLDAIRMIPLDRIVLETDAPYFTPPSFRNYMPKSNLPGLAALVAFHIAKYRNISVDEVMRAAKCNTARIYNLEPIV